MMTLLDYANVTTDMKIVKHIFTVDDHRHSRISSERTIPLMEAL